ncbi:MAG: hypothetical protein ACLFR7_06970 [Opitutales bacterium]
MERYDPLLHDDALDAVRRARRPDRRILVELAEPHQRADTTYTDTKGRVVARTRGGRFMID